MSPHDCSVGRQRGRSGGPDTNINKQSEDRHGCSAGCRLLQTASSPRAVTAQEGVRGSRNRHQGLVWDIAAKLQGHAARKACAMRRFRGPPRPVGPQKGILSNARALTDDEARFGHCETADSTASQWRMVRRRRRRPGQLQRHRGSVPASRVSSVVAGSCDAMARSLSVGIATKPGSPAKSTRPGRSAVPRRAI